MFVCYNFSGASPDGTVQCSCCGAGLIEVKCPYSVRGLFAEDWKLNWLKYENNQVTISKEHSYFYQIQAQLAICEKEYCDLVIWSEKSLLVKRIFPDPEFWKIILNKVNIFHKQIIMPELVAKYFSRSKVPNN